MRITEITRSISKTIQEKDYEPVNVFASAKAEVDATDDIKTVSQALAEFVQDQVGVTLSNKDYEKWTNPQAFLRRKQKEKEEKAF